MNSMAQHHSVNKPPRIGVSGEHMPRLSEVYGFVGSISIVVATGIFVVWAYVPDHWLHSVGINAYPRRYWSMPVPTYVLVTIVLAIGVYIGLNFLATPPPTSLKSMFDEFSELLDDEDDEHIPGPLSDISPNKVTELLNDLK